MYEVQHEQKRSKVYTLYLLCDALNIFIHKLGCIRKKL